MTAADLVRQFGKWQDRASARPIFITHHGRDRFVLQSATNYAALRARSVHRAAAPIAEPVFDQMIEGFIAFDTDYRITAINPPAAAYLRLTREDAIGTSPFEQDAFRKSLIFSQLERTLRSGAYGAFDAPSPAFADRWLAVRSLAYGDGVACLLRDVTDIVIERRAGREAEALQAALATHARIGRAWLSPRGTFTRVNSTLATMIGLDRDALTGARLIDVLPLGCRQMAREAIEAAFRGDRAHNLAAELLCKDGRQLPVEIALAAFRDERGEGGAVAIIAPA